MTFTLPILWKINQELIIHETVLNSAVVQFLLWTLRRNSWFVNVSIQICWEGFLGEPHQPLPLFALFSTRWHYSRRMTSYNIFPCSVLQLSAAQCTVNMINNDKWDLLCVWKKPWTSAPHRTNIAGNHLCVHTQDQQQTQWALQNTSHTSGNNSLSLQSYWIQVFNHSMSTWCIKSSTQAFTLFYRHLWKKPGELQCGTVIGFHLCNKCSHEIRVRKITERILRLIVRICHITFAQSLKTSKLYVVFRLTQEQCAESSLKTSWLSCVFCHLGLKQEKHTVSAWTNLSTLRMKLRVVRLFHYALKRRGK